MSRYLILMTAAFLALSGCAVDPEPTSAPDHPPRRLAERPEDLDDAKGSANGRKSKKPKDEKGSDDPTKSPDDAVDKDDGNGNGGDDGDSGPDGDGGNDGKNDDDDRPSTVTPTTPPDGEEVAFTTLTSGSDERSDHGDGPKYADVASLTLEGSERDLRLIIEMGGAIPGQLSDGRVMGLGVDLYREQQGESDFQIFLDGGADGWFAYLDTPRGFVDFPGTFGIGDDSFIVTVPWKSIGKLQTGYATEFADLSDENSNFSEDFLPEDGRLRFSR